MDCLESSIGYNEFKLRMRGRLDNQRVPLSGTLELNFRCNLRCKHCYVSYGHTGLPGLQELSLSEIQRILDEITAAGCLWLLLTGGEILVRRDFAEIYRYAKRKGLLLTLFTNATLLNQPLVSLLAEYPPLNLEITLYGATQETYERVTGIPGSYRRCYQAIELLQQYGVPFSLKTVLMTLNVHEFSAMQQFAKSQGVQFRYDPLINGGIDGCGKPFNVRLPADQAVQVSLMDDQFAPSWFNLIQRYQSQTDRSQESLLYKCSAGLTSFSIDPYGQLSMCVMARQNSFDLRQGSFQQGWEQFLKAERFLPAPANHACHGCQLLPVCNACPGWSFTETGDSTAHVDYLCQVTHLRAQALGLQH
jgi:radical SAM protein with 4Fe4S-binding SPASM domain